MHNLNQHWSNKKGCRAHSSDKTWFQTESMAGFSTNSAYEGSKTEQQRL